MITFLPGQLALLPIRLQAPSSGGVDSAMELGPQESHEVEVVFDRPAGDTVSHLGILAIESNAGSSPDAVFFTVSAPGMGQ